MSLLVFAVSVRSWAHMGLITFVPFYYIHVLKGDSHHGREVGLCLSHGRGGGFLLDRGRIQVGR